MIFKRRVLVNTNLEIEEIVFRLKKVTIKKYIINSDNKGYVFEGIFKDNFFLIWPIFDYGTNYLFRPKISGQMNNIEKKMTTIILDFTLSIWIKSILICSVILGIWKIVDAIVNTSYIQLVINTGVLFGFLGIMKMIFNYKVSRSIDIITKIVRGGNNL